MKVSIVIATYNMKTLIWQTIWSILQQDYPDKEIIVYDDCSTDNTEEYMKGVSGVRYVRGDKNLGVGEAFNEGIKLAQGDIVILFCADDLFCDDRVISDIVETFKSDKKIGHVSRYYHQFIDGLPSAPVRAWRTQDPVIQANNPTGLAFKKEALKTARCSNRMFIETSYLVAQVLKDWKAVILPYDTIKARVHRSTSTQPGYFKKRRVSSPVEDWMSIGGTAILKDYASFIQIKRGHSQREALREMARFVRYRPLNLLSPMFWFYSIFTLVTPAFLLFKIPEFYRLRIGRLITKEVKRP